MIVLKSLMRWWNLWQKLGQLEAKLMMINISQGFINIKNCWKKSVPARLDLLNISSRAIHFCFLHYLPRLSHNCFANLLFSLCWYMTSAKENIARCKTLTADTKIDFNGAVARNRSNYFYNDETIFCAMHFFVLDFRRKWTWNESCLHRVSQSVSSLDESELCMFSSTHMFAVMQKATRK